MHQIPFKGYLMRILLPPRHLFLSVLVVVVAIVVVVIVVVVVAAAVVINKTSGCGSSSKTLSWNDKYKLGVMARVRAGKYNLGPRVGKCRVSVRVDKHKFWGQS